MSHDLISISFPGPAAFPLMFTKGHVIAQGKGERVISQGGGRGKKGPGSLRKGAEESKCYWEQTTWDWGFLQFCCKLGSWSRSLLGISHNCLCVSVFSIHHRTWHDTGVK